jgi:phospholipid-binding lipoprotein MlaA
MKSDARMSAFESRARQFLAAAMLILVGAVSGCATVATPNPRDPLESFNRGVYTFNDALDRAILKPVATGYRTVIPQFARTGVRNFFSNLDDLAVIVNNLLQFKLQQAASDTGRFLLNSTVGVLGLVDVASHVGLEKHNEDFGQTLGYWGIGSGPYLVLPLLGPSSFRDGIGRIVDMYTDVVWNIERIRLRNVLLATRVVSNREALLDSEKILDTAALDRYSFIRDAYLQRRRSLVYDGNPPPEPEDEPAPATPRSEIEPAFSPSVLVDQHGGIVAAPAPAAAVEAAVSAPTPAGAAPQQPPTSAEQPAGAPASPAPAEPAAAAVEPSAAAEPSAAEASSAAASSNDAPRIVRVWLPESR